jgi:hypothetical protein
MAGVKDSFEESFAEYEGEAERPEADETAAFKSDVSSVYLSFSCSRLNISPQTGILRSL